LKWVDDFQSSIDDGFEVAHLHSSFNAKNFQWRRDYVNFKTESRPTTNLMAD